MWQAEEYLCDIDDLTAASARLDDVIDSLSTDAPSEELEKARQLIEKATAILLAL